MNGTATEEVFGRKPVETRPIMGGIQHRFRMDNGYGASVVRHSGSYGSAAGLWELAVLLYDGDEWRLTYDTAITDDVIGHLSDAEVVELLDRIDALPEDGVR